jgi:hypothetical protein
VPNFTIGAANFGESAGQANPAYVTRLGSNPPVNPPVPVDQVLGLANNPSGLIYNGALNFPGNVSTGENSVPYVQNWSLSLQRQIGKGVLELSYVGSKGTHLFMPSVVLNNPSTSYLASLANLNVKATTTVPDPLARRNANGAVTPIYLYTLASPYLGYNGISTYYDASGNSSFNAAVVSYRYQANHLTLYSNFRWSKSLDNASDSSPDKQALSTGSVGGGQYSFGGTAAGDKSVSTYNIPYNFNLVAVYDLPFGKGRAFANNAPTPVQLLAGGWSISGVERIASGYPFTPTIAADNFIDTFHTHEIRPDIVSGVPVVNPDWNRNCPTTALCAPYINTSAFQLPVAGQIGNAPRTLSGAIGPLVQTLDLSVQKNWSIGEKRRIQLRVDALNVLNHPVFRNVPNVGGGTDVFGNYPSFAWTDASLQGVYNSWQAANPTAAFPLSDPRGLAAYQSFRNGILSQQNSAGTLPANYYSIPLPAHFVTTPANSFNILDPSGNGFKYYQIRNQTGNGNTLTWNNTLNQQRYLQFGIKIVF